jgi:hypothetical protein
MTTIWFSAVAWLLWSGSSQMLMPVPPFKDEAHCKAMIEAQGMGKDVSCIQVWIKQDGAVSTSISQ